MEQVPAGWYGDPNDAAQQRWWDGTAWSAATRPVPAATPAAAWATSPPAMDEAAARQPTAPHAPSPGGTWPPAGSGATWSAAPTTGPATDPLAIVALVTALLWVMGLGSLVAIVCGIVVLRRGAEGTSRTLALIGLVLGVLGLLPALLVLAVLGAISVPVFMGQQQAALEAQLHSDLRNAAIVQEEVFTTSGAYIADASELEAARGGFESPITVARADRTGYCLEATNESGTAHYDSHGGGVADGPCG